MTIREFAKYCQISPATVSRYFNDEMSIGEDNRNTIETALTKTGYTHKFKKTKRDINNNLIVTLLTEWHHVYNQDLISAIQKECQRLGKRMIVEKIENNRPLKCIDPIKKMHPEGVILLHEDTDDYILETFVQNGIPIVLCSGLTRNHTASSVYVNNISASYDGANYLLDLGHKEIAIISDKSEVLSSGFHRLTGCLRAYEEHGIKIKDDHIFSVGSDYKDGYLSMEAVIKTLPNVTGVFAFSDAAACGAIAAVIDSGKKVPDDYSVLGFDNSLISTTFRPQITTIGQPKDQIAKLAVQELLSRDKPKGVQLPHTLIERESCRKI